jgi:hypothetical protein
MAIYWLMAGPLLVYSWLYCYFPLLPFPSPSLLLFKLLFPPLLTSYKKKKKKIKESFTGGWVGPKGVGKRKSSKAYYKPRNNRGMTGENPMDSQ